VVVALKTRSVEVTTAVAQSLDAFEWLRRSGCEQFVFKICSTFDSTPAGNIGPVGEALAAQLGVCGVPVCPAFPAAGRTVYEGHLFVRDRLLSESGLDKHPLNPMTDPDIRRWLRRQTFGAVGHIGHAVVAKGATVLRSALNNSQEALVVVDAICDNDLVTIGEACASSPLLVGGSGIAEGLPANFRRAGRLSDRQDRFRRVHGAGAILSGSCSAVTRGQIAAYASRGPALRIDVEALMEDRLPLTAVVAFARKYRRSGPMIYSSAEPAEVLRVQERFGEAAVARRVEQLFGQIACTLADEGLARLVVAGGESAGAIVSALRIRRLKIGPEIETGVPTLFAEGERSVALALKSGNFGSPDFFQTALEALGDEDP
jgi:3-dehydrotetronate 4-kinase